MGKLKSLKIGSKRRLRINKRKAQRSKGKRIPIHDVSTLITHTCVKVIQLNKGLPAEEKDNRPFITFLKKGFPILGELNQKRKRDTVSEIAKAAGEKEKQDSVDSLKKVFYCYYYYSAYWHVEILPQEEPLTSYFEDLNKSKSRKRKCWKSDSSPCKRVTAKRSKSEEGLNSERLLCTSSGRKSWRTNLNKTLIDNDSGQSDVKNRKERTFQQLPLPSSRKSQYKIPKKHAEINTDESSVETQSKEIRCYEVEGGCVLHITHPETISLQGRAFISVLSGEVCVFGHRLTKDTPAVKLFSPISHSLVSISSVKGYGKSGSNHIKKICQKHSFAKADVDHLMANVTRESVLLFLKKFNSTCCDFVTKYFPLQSLNGSVSQDHFNTPLHDVNQTLGSIGAQVYPLKDCSLPAVHIPEEFITVFDKWLKALEQKDVSPKMMSCGGKNAGKSTFNRYIINSTVQHSKRVCYLDCDVGQSEFNPPGCVALHIIDKPVIGPPFTHQQDPHFMCFFGLVSPSENPRRYSSCVQRVYQEYERMDPKLPLITNTMGWNKGLGVNLLIDVLHVTQPDMVVQLDSMNQVNNFPAITPDFMHRSPGWVYNRDHQPGEEESPFQHELIIVDSPVVPSIESQFRFAARDHRDMSILGYFSQCLKPRQSLQEVQPFCIPWKNLALHTCHLAVPPSEILGAINASIVALCEADLEKARGQRKHPDLPLQLESTPFCQCLGFGIVRGIDMNKELIYLITPLELPTLQRVNTLIRGTVNIPDQVLLEQRYEGLIPYVGTHLSMTGASSVRARRYMPRRRREPSEAGEGCAQTV